MNPGTGPHKKHPKLSLFWKIVSISSGSLLILLGIVGLFLPILQGWLMIFAGLALLSPHSKWAHSIMTWLKAKLRIGQRASATSAPDPERQAEQQKRKEGA